MEPQIQYVRSADGTSIAYYEMGEGVPLIFSPNIWDHLTARWQGEAKDASLQLVRDGFRLIRYDMRGMGLSDRNVHDFSLEAQSADLEAVRERLRLDQFALYSNVHAGLVCTTYVARHPERVTHLIMRTPFANGESWYQALPTMRGLESFRAMGDEHWELYTLTHATALFAQRPDSAGDPHRDAAIMRAAATPDGLRRYFDTLRSQDVTAILSVVRAPTLVLQVQGELSQFSAAIAASIPHARLVRIGQTFEAPSAEAAAHITRFVLGHDPTLVDQAGTDRRHASSTAVILFADVVDSTAMQGRIGNAAFRERTRALEEALRTVMRQAGGAPVAGRTLGDGVIGTFTSAAQAIEAALRCEEHAERVELQLHLGIHAGDVIQESGNVSGIAVSIAARISDLTAPNEILVSSTVRDLARASTDVTFEDRGEHALKGVGEPQRVFAVRRGG